MTAIIAVYFRIHFWIKSWKCTNPEGERNDKFYCDRLLQQLLRILLITVCAGQTKRNTWNMQTFYLHLNLCEAVWCKSDLKLCLAWCLRNVSELQHNTSALTIIIHGSFRCQWETWKGKTLKLLRFHSNPFLLKESCITIASQRTTKPLTN